jgi:broad specificity phosphatase PhoE
MYIYLTRHGETIWNIQRRTQGIRDTELSDRGIRQAEVLAEKLSGESFSQIYSSTLKRAYHTAAVIGERHSICPVKRKELNEVNFGVWEGLTRNQIEAEYPGQVDRHRKDFSFEPHQGESLYSLQNRICNFIQYIQDRHNADDERILVVAHSYPVRMLIVKLLGFPLRHLWDFQLDNTGISIIQWKSDRRRLVCLNDTSHLSGL